MTAAQSVAVWYAHRHSAGNRAKLVVAQSTNPPTTSGWRRHTNWATIPPIE